MAFRIAAAILLVLAIVGAVLGYVFANELTIGPVFLGIGAVLAVFARMAQAEFHQFQQIERLKAIHIMIRDEIDRASIVPGRSRDFAPVADDEEDDNG